MTTDRKPEVEDLPAADENAQTLEDIVREIGAGFDEARRGRIIALLREFREGDPEEQRETFEVLRKGLNEAHPDRLIFPPELKGITW
jgi:hypothetical protein